MADDKKKMTVGDCLGNDGPLPTIPWGDKTVNVYKNCPDVIGHMEMLVLEAVRANLDALEDKLPAAEYARQRQAVDDGVLANYYAFGQRWFLAQLGGADGAAMMLAACVRPGCPEYTVKDARRAMATDTAKVMDALVVALPSFFAEGAKARDMDPASVAPLVNQMIAEFKKASKKLTGKSSRK